MAKPIEVLKPATADNFQEEAYLAANPGVRAAVARGQFTSGRHHFETFGHREHRKLFDPEQIRKVIELRHHKMARLGSRLDTSLPHSVNEETGQVDFLSPELRAQFNISSTDNVSSHDYGEEATALIAAHPDGLILDCGAGLRSTYYPNIINFEIAPYYSTDVAGVGERLPFADESFDAVISIAVLEHVRDPFLCAAEILRVLKPGGSLLSAVPFLHEYHGFPHHYFNMTLQGHRRVYEEGVEIEEVVVPQTMWPIKTLQRFLRIYRKDLEGATREAFEQLTVKQIIERDIYEHFRRPYARELSEDTREILAGGSVLTGTKKRPDKR